MSMSYKHLYKKYKFKYLSLKHKIGGNDTIYKKIIDEIFNIPEFDKEGKPRNIKDIIEDISSILSSNCIQLSEHDKYKCEMIMLVLKVDVSEQINKLEEKRIEQEIDNVMTDMPKQEYIELINTIKQKEIDDLNNMKQFNNAHDMKIDNYIKNINQLNITPDIIKQYMNNTDTFIKNIGTKMGLYFSRDLTTQDRKIKLKINEQLDYIIYSIKIKLSDLYNKGIQIGGDPLFVAMGICIIVVAVLIVLFSPVIINYMQQQSPQKSKEHTYEDSIVSQSRLIPDIINKTILAEKPTQIYYVKTDIHVNRWFELKNYFHKFVIHLWYKEITTTYDTNTHNTTIGNNIIHLFFFNYKKKYDSIKIIYKDKYDIDFKKRTSSFNMFKKNDIVYDIEKPENDYIKGTIPDIMSKLNIQFKVIDNKFEFTYSRIKSLRTSLVQTENDPVFKSHTITTDIENSIILVINKLTCHIYECEPQKT